MKHFAGTFCRAQNLKLRGVTRKYNYIGSSIPDAIFDRCCLKFDSITPISIVLLLKPFAFKFPSSPNSILIGRCCFSFIALYWLKLLSYLQWDVPHRYLNSSHTHTLQHRQLPVAFMQRLETKWRKKTSKVFEQKVAGNRLWTPFKASKKEVQ